jgi:hypothetical protein
MTGFEHANQSEQLKMFMTPREILKDSGPHDADRWITATDQPDGIGTMGDQTSQHPLMMASRPEEFGLVPTYNAPEFEGRKEADAYAERWHQSKEKFDRGEGNDPDSGDMYYEAGDYAPGTREHNEWQGYTNPDFTDRENYLDQWMGYTGVGGIKEDMTREGFTGSVDDYLDWQATENYEYQKSRKQFNLENVHDPSTWFENDEQYWDRTLKHAKTPTEQLRNVAKAEGELNTMSMFPEGEGAFARVAGMGVEDPITLGTIPEVNIRGDIKRAIWGGEHDVISAYKQKPDVLIPVQHTGRTGSYGSMQGELHPHAKRQEGAEAFINNEQDEIAAKSDIDRAVRSAHIELMRMDEGGEEEVRRRFPSHRPPSDSLSKEFYVTRHNSDPNQTKAF